MSKATKRQPRSEQKKDPNQEDEQIRKDEEANTRSFDGPAPSNFEEDRPPDIVVEN